VFLSTGCLMLRYSEAQAMATTPESSNKLVSLYIYGVCITLSKICARSKFVKMLGMRCSAHEKCSAHEFYHRRSVHFDVEESSSYGALFVSIVKSKRNVRRAASSKNLDSNKNSKLKHHHFGT
jgi:hypothetical protein